jgi:hypothetical protein
MRNISFLEQVADSSPFAMALRVCADNFTPLPRERTITVQSPSLHSALFVTPMVGKIASGFSRSMICLDLLGR